MKQKILVIDDEKMMTDLLCDHLEDEGYQVLAANGAAAGLRLLPKEPDLILLDINMPGTDGLTLCRQIRDHVMCPILFLTARVTEQDKVNGLKEGGDDYITKPFSLKELTARVEAHLRRDAPGGRHSAVLTSGELLVNLAERRVFFRQLELEFFTPGVRPSGLSFVQCSLFDYRTDTGGGSGYQGGTSDRIRGRGQEPASDYCNG